MLYLSHYARMRKRISGALLALVLLITLVIVSVPVAQAQGGGAPELFTSVSGVIADAPQGNPSYIARSRYVSVNWGLLLNERGQARDVRSTPEIALNLFPDASYVGVINKVEKNAAGGDSWIGILEGKQGYFYLVVSNGVFIAHVASTEGVYEVSWAGENLYKAVQLDQSKFIDDAPGEMDPPGPVYTQADFDATADSGATIDVMVVYTSAARLAEGSTAAMKARIALAVTETNSSYANAGIVPRIRLVHVQEVSYAESGNLSTDVNRLANPIDGFIDNVHSLRNIYGADMVSLIVENGGIYCGIAKAIMATEASAFDVTVRSCATGYYSFGHEFGHLQGARHDTTVDPVNTPFAYGHGYVHTSSDPAQRWRTVMAYNDACQNLGYDCTRLQYWSNPVKSYLGAAMGLTGSSENYKVLNATAFTVANFRGNRIGNNFSSPFTTNSNGWVPVVGTWTLTSGFLETAGVAARWSSIQHLGVYGDLTFEANMRRAGCAGCPNGLWIRGNPASLTLRKDWKPSYQFSYANNGYFSVWRVNSNGALAALTDWTASPAIHRGGWNRLKVVAVGPSLKFYINGTLVWSGRSSLYPIGRVGIAMYRSAASIPQQLYVDWARLSTTATADMNLDEAVAPAVEVPGGDNRHSP